MIKKDIQYRIINSTTSIDLELFFSYRHKVYPFIESQTIEGSINPLLNGIDTDKLREDKYQLFLDSGIGNAIDQVIIDLDDLISDIENDENNKWQDKKDEYIEYIESYKQALQGERLDEYNSSFECVANAKKEMFSQFRISLNTCKLPHIERILMNELLLNEEKCEEEKKWEDGKFVFTYLV
ncbi:MAG: hypothetical protein ACRDCB_06785 [Clostridium sp.]